jgi:hypothetical protein
MIKNNNWTDELISWAIEHHIPEPNSDELLKEGLNPYTTPRKSNNFL